MLSACMVLAQLKTSLLRTFHQTCCCDSLSGLVTICPIKPENGINLAASSAFQPCLPDHSQIVSGFFACSKEPN